DVIDAECAFHRVGNAVRLHHVADAEAREATEYGKHGAEPLPAFRHAVANRVHRPADPAAVFVALAKFHGNDDFSIFRRHADQRRHPHPAHGTRSTEGDRGCNAHDVAHTYGCRKAGHQGRERTHFTTAFIAAAAAPDHAEAGADHANGHSAQTNLQVQASAENQHQHRGAPNEAVYRVE